MPFCIEVEHLLKFFVRNSMQVATYVITTAKNGW